MSPFLEEELEIAINFDSPLIYLLINIGSLMSRKLKYPLFNPYYSGYMEEVCLRDILLSLTKRMIEAPSFDRQEANVAEIIIRELENTGLELEKQKVERGRYNLIARTPGRPCLFICGHMDTVFPGTSWTVTDPLRPVMKGNLLYGLGASDMKGNLACTIVAIKETLKKKPTLQNLVLLFDVDEETDFLGMKEFISKTRRFSPKLALFTEPTSLKICNAHRGLIEIHLDAKGKSAHAAECEKGINAIEGIYAAVRKLKEYLQLRTHDTLGKSTCNLAYLHGGTWEKKQEEKEAEVKPVANKIPDFGKAILDIRNIPDITSKEITDILEKEMRSSGLTEINIEVKHDYGPLYTPREKLTLFEACVREVVGRAEYDIMTGYTEAEMIGARHNVPTVIFGAGPRTGHNPDEHVSISSLVKTEQTLERVIAAYCGNDFN